MMTSSSSPIFKIQSSVLSHDARETMASLLPAAFVERFSWVYVLLDTDKKFSQEVIDKAGLLFTRYFAQAETAKQYQRKQQKEVALEWQKKADDDYAMYQKLVEETGINIKLNTRQALILIKESFVPNSFLLFV